MLRRPFLFASSVVILIFGQGCLRKQNSDSKVESRALSPVLNRCVALRGNGTHMVAHTTALAKITSRWGEIHAIAGGSSATLSTFLYESILMNPALKSQTDDQRRKAISLLLKSVTGFAAETAAEPEWQALRVIGTIGSRIQEKGVLSLPPSEYREASEALKTVLLADDIRNLVNPEILQMLSNQAEPAFKDFQSRVEEVKKAAASLTNLDGSDPDVFFRPGLVNFPYFVKLMGQVGDFYAGYGRPQSDMADFLQACSEGTDDQLWREISRKPTRNGTCGERFASMVRSWKDSSAKGSKSRLDDPQGLGLRSIMITSVVENQDGKSALKKYEAAYHSGEERRLDFNFDDVKFGYWVSSSIAVDPVTSWRVSNPDGKSKKAMSLGSAKSWRQILEKSPREPSLGKLVEFSADEGAKGALSLGGWADLHPVQVLKAAGCDKVIYLTRRTGETTFISPGPPFTGRKPFGLAELLGMTKYDYDSIYNLSEPNSGFSRALKQADGIWCTNWNKYTAMEQDGIAADGWASPLLTKDSELSKWPEADVSGQPILGCR